MEASVRVARCDRSLMAWHLVYKACGCMMKLPMFQILRGSLLTPTCNHAIALSFPISMVRLLWVRPHVRSCNPVKNFSGRVHEANSIGVSTRLHFFFRGYRRMILIISFDTNVCYSIATVCIVCCMGYSFTKDPDWLNRIEEYDAAGYPELLSSTTRDSHSAVTFQYDALCLPLQCASIRTLLY